MKKILYYVYPQLNFELIIIDKTYSKQDITYTVSRLKLPATIEMYVSRGRSPPTTTTNTLLK